MSFLKKILRKRKKPKEEAEERHWSEIPASEKKTIGKKIKRAWDGPKRLPGTQRIKRGLSVLLLPIYLGICVFMLGENPVVEVFFVATVYILIDYIAITQVGSIWNVKPMKVSGVGMDDD